jgi:hypothetical protein
LQAYSKYKLEIAEALIKRDAEFYHTRKEKALVEYVLDGKDTTKAQADHY